MTAIEGIEVERILKSEDPLFEWVGLSDKYQLQIVSDLYSRRAAADALAEKSRRLEEAIINCEADRYLDIIVEWREWQDALRQYREVPDA